MRKRASWLILDTSGELFIISLTLEMGSEMFLLLADVCSSFSGVFPDIFTRAQRETDLLVVLNCDAVLLLPLNKIPHNCNYVMSPPIDVESLLPPVNMYGARLEKLEQCCCSLPSRSVVALNHRIAPCKPQREREEAKRETLLLTMAYILQLK